MRVTYDEKVDALTVRLREGASIVRTVEVGLGLLDLDADGRIVALEVLGASAVFENAVELATQEDLAGDLPLALRICLDEAQEQLELSELHANRRSSHHLP
jgi:uncharacterized protein YuzE